MTSREPLPQLGTDLGALPIFAAQPAARMPASAPAGAAHLLGQGQHHPAPQMPEAPSAAETAEGGVHIDDIADLEWDVIARLRRYVAGQLADALAADEGLTQLETEARAQAHISEAISQHVEGQIRDGGQELAWSDATRQLAAKAIFNDLFRLGRIQPIVDDEQVENVDIYGWDNVWVDYADGTRRRHKPIASSDAALLEDLAFLASRDGENARAWSQASPILDMDLPGNARLAAVHPPISPRPKAVLRIHRYVDITLDDLVAKESLTRESAAFLSAAVKAGKSIVVSGYPGAGKTTLVRALTNEMDPLEQIVTIEKERELHLDRMGERHQIVTPLQARPGSGERHADGTRAGEVTLVDLLEEALRLNAQRIIVGEVRGSEIDAMFQAMQAGVGSMSTIHASSPSNAIERMASLTLRNLVSNADYAYRQVAQHISLIVQVRKIVTDGGTRHRRVVTHISEVQPGETSSGGGMRPVASDLWVRDRHGELRPGSLPSPDLAEDLLDAGLDPHIISREGV